MSFLVCRSFRMRPLTPGLRIHLAGVVGVYIVGVTWFARTEEGRSNRRQLIAAAIRHGAVARASRSFCGRSSRPERGTVLFPYLLVAFGFLVGRPVARAIVIARSARGAGRGEAMRPGAGRRSTRCSPLPSWASGAGDPFAVAARSRDRKMGLLDLTIPESSDWSRYDSRSSHVPARGGAAVAGLLNPDVSAQDQPADPARGREGRSSPTHEAKMRPLEVSASLRPGGTRTSSGKDEDFQKKEEAQNKIDAALSDPKPFAALKGIKAARDAGKIADANHCAADRSALPRVPRKAGPARPAQEDHRQGQRGRAGVQRLPRKVDGQEMADSKVRSVLKESADSALRQKVWEASKGVGKVVEARPQGTGEAPQRSRDQARLQELPRHDAHSQRAGRRRSSSSSSTNSTT